MNEKSIEKLLGSIFVTVGLAILFKSMRVSSFGFWDIRGFSTSGVVIILMILSGIAIVVNPNKITKGCMIAALCILIISVIMGTHITFVYMSVLDLTLILVPLVVGTGLLIKSSIFSNGNR